MPTRDLVSLTQWVQAVQYGQPLPPLHTLMGDGSPPTCRLVALLLVGPSSLFPVIKSSRSSHMLGHDSLCLWAWAQAYRTWSWEAELLDWGLLGLCGQEE